MFSLVKYVWIGPGVGNNVYKFYNTHCFIKYKFSNGDFILLIGL